MFIYRIFSQKKLDTNIGRVYMISYQLNGVTKMNRSTFAIFFIFMLLMVSVAIAIQISVWNECRAEGHSFFYCVNLVSGK